MKHLSSGYFGYVFDAEHSSTQTRYAVKVLRVGTSGSAIPDFENETELVRRLAECENVIGYVDSGVGRIEVDHQGAQLPLDIQYLVLARASGSLDELVLDPESRKRLSTLEKLRLWRDVVAGVRQMHARNFVHRDLKSSNCLLMVRKSYSKVEIADFGRSKDLSQPLTRAPHNYSLGMGDLRFAPPEFLYLQGKHSPDAFLAADYYGVGSVLVELITGHPITSLVFEDSHNVISQSKEDYVAGRSRDLGALVGRFRAIVADVVQQMPACTRQDASAVLNHICHPEPSVRASPSPFRKDRLDKDGLLWVIKRIDVMIKQLEVQANVDRRSAQVERQFA